MTELAAELIGVSRVCVTLIDADYTTAKSMIGFPEGSPQFAPVADTFCRLVVASGRPLVVDDARSDPRTAGDPAIDIFDAAAWVGYPVVDADGVVLGTFCLMDSHPHEWSPQDLHIIATLAKAASSEILLRMARVEIASLRRQRATIGIEPSPGGPPTGPLTAVDRQDRAAVAACGSPANRGVEQALRLVLTTFLVGLR